MQVQSKNSTGKQLSIYKKRLFESEQGHMAGFRKVEPERALRSPRKEFNRGVRRERRVKLLMPGRQGCRRSSMPTGCRRSTDCLKKFTRRSQRPRRLFLFQSAILNLISEINGDPSR